MQDEETPQGGGDAKAEFSIGFKRGDATIEITAGDMGLVATDGRDHWVAYHVPAEVRLSNHSGLPYDVVVAVAPDRSRGGQIGISGIELHQREGGERITAQGLRKVPLGKIFPAILDLLTFDAEDGPLARDSLGPKEKAKLRNRGLRNPASEKRRRLTDDDLRQVALVANSAPHGEQVRAVRRLRDCGEAQAKRLLRRAREQGHLPESERSRKAKERRAT